MKVKGRLRETSKNVIDLLFDFGWLREDVTRDNMNRFEQFIGDILVEEYETSVRLHGIIEGCKNLEVGGGTNPEKPTDSPE